MSTGQQRYIETLEARVAEMETALRLNLDLFETAARIMRAHLDYVESWEPRRGHVHGCNALYCDARCQVGSMKMFIEGVTAAKGEGND